MTIKRTHHVYAAMPVLLRRRITKLEIEELSEQSAALWHIGQELLTRMRTRNKMGRKLVSIPNADAKESEITTHGIARSLAIVRD